MKIAIILFGDYLKDGRVQRTAEALSEKYEVKVFVTTDYIDNYPSIYHGVSIKMTSLKSKKLSNHPLVQVIKFIEYFIVTSKQLNKFNPDIVFCNDVYTLFFGWWFKKKKQKRFIYDSHELWKDTMHHYAYNAKLYKMLYWFQKKTIHKTDAVVTVNESIAEILKKDHKINLPIVVMNINDGTISQYKNNDIIRNQIHIDHSTKIVLYIGSIAKGRGLENIIESVKYWNDDIVLVLLGTGVLELELKEVCRTKALDERVYFLGSVPQKEVLVYASACDAGIMPILNLCRSYYCSLPNKFFQFAQMRKTVLASNFPEMESKVKEFNLGETFNPNSINEIAHAVNSIFDSGFQISKDNHKRFIAKYNWENEKKKLLKLITEIEE